METDARYVIVGLFAAIIAAAAFGFVYWLEASGGLVAKRSIYRVEFEVPVIGLRPGVPVLFNGLRVGEVQTVQLDPHNPKALLASLAIDPATPVREDTRVGVDTSGLLGSINVSLFGGAPEAAPAREKDVGPPLLVADPEASESLGQTAKQAVNKLNVILNDNAAPLRNAIANLSSFSDALARNSGRVDQILAGLEKMTGGGTPPPPPTYYDLTAPKFPPPSKTLTAQIAVAEPSALVMFQTQRALISPKPGEIRPLEGGQWSDNLPILIKAKLVQTLENAGFKGAAGAQEGISTDFQLFVDIRHFEIALDPAPSAHVELAAKLVGADGKIIGAKDFDASGPAAGVSAAEAFAALNDAFGQVAHNLGLWMEAII